MRQNSAKGPIFLTLLFLAVFLCCIPSVSSAVQSSSIPEPTDTCVVPAETDVANLRSFFQLTNSYKITVYKADGSVRSGGYVATDDRAVILNSKGKLVSCFLIIVEGESSSSSTESSSEPPEASDASSTPASEVPEPEASSSSTESEPPVSSEVPPVSSEIIPPASSANPSSAPEAPVNQDMILEESIPVSYAEQLLSGEASRVTVISSDGLLRKDGLVCTGDRFVLQDESGNVFRTMTVTVLGDLTRCGRPTERACTILYDFLTENSSLPADLMAAADINGDQRVDTADLLRMKQMLLKTSSSGE
jgi:hypothetical protein